MLDRIKQAWRSEPSVAWTVVTLAVAAAWTWALWGSIMVTTTTDDPYAGLLLILTVPMGTVTFLWLLAHWRRVSRHWDTASDGKRQAWVAVVAVPVVVGALWGGRLVASGVHDLRVDRAEDRVLQDLRNIEREAVDEIRGGEGVTFDDHSELRRSLYVPQGTAIDARLAEGAQRWGFDRIALIDEDGDGETDQVLAHQPGLVNLCAWLGHRGVSGGRMVPEPSYEVGASACDGTVIATWPAAG